MDNLSHEVFNQAMYMMGGLFAVSMVVAIIAMNWQKLLLVKFMIGLVLWLHFVGIYPS